MGGAKVGAGEMSGARAATEGTGDRKGAGGAETTGSAETEASVGTGANAETGAGVGTKRRFDAKTEVGRIAAGETSAEIEDTLNNL